MQKADGGNKKNGNRGRLFFFAIFGPRFSLHLSTKLAPIYRAGESVILSSTGKKSQPLIRLEESKPLVQRVHLELSNLAIQGCGLPEGATLSQ